jgi:hypothetical protein
VRDGEANGEEKSALLQLGMAGDKANGETVGGGQTGSAILGPTVAVSVWRRQSLRTTGQLRSELSTRAVSIWPCGCRGLLSLRAALFLWAGPFNSSFPILKFIQLIKP